MTLKTLIEEWKEKFFEKFPHLYGSMYSDFIKDCMTAAARGAAEASMVKISQQPSSGSIPDIIHSTIGWNDYMIQSSQQLTSYFE